MPSYKYVKVFGERNSGTNFLRKLCSLNFPELNALSHGSNPQLKERSQLFPANLKRFALERMIDSQRRSEFPENFGWKHASISPDYLRISPRFDETLFVVVLRNPYCFISSLFRRPYNIIAGDYGNVSEFIRGPIIANERDNIDDAFIETPMQIWNLKTHSYLKTARLLANVKLARYEDIVQNVECYVKWLSHEGLHAPDEAIVPIASTKNDPKDFYVYKEAVQNYDPSRNFCIEDLDFIESKIDNALSKFLCYDRVDLGNKPSWEGNCFFSP